MRRHDFAYDLPEDLIAQTPLPERSAGRLLVLDGRSGALADRFVRDLPSLLEPGDLLVLNDTRVVAARLQAVKPTGGRVEVLLERPIGPDRALVHLRASKPIRESLRIDTAAGPIRVLERQGDLWLVELPGPAVELFDTWGQTPLPPYIRRAAEDVDRERYQSIFAREAGAVAAPTASLHFDERLVAALDARGVSRAFVTLHVGAGTFQPVRTDDLESHVMHAERVSVDSATCEAIARTRAAGGRIVAVGTTVVRALESAALETTGTDRDRPVAPRSGETRLFIRPPFRFRVTDALLTNFHLPESTLLMLVCAFAGRDKVLAAYAHAVRQRYRFFSYGDAMFVTPARREGS